MSAPQPWAGVVARLQERGLEFAPGLDDEEAARVEARFGFRFPPDLRAFLTTALPRGDGFPDWRAGDEAALRDRLDLPRRGVLFDVARNGFWLDEWGPRPERAEDAERAAAALIDAAPKLIPVFRHRMMPDEPAAAGNPVFSVHQTDIIVYGADLADYLRAEFEPGADAPSAPAAPRAIRFWDIDRFQSVRWSKGPVEFDNSGGGLP